MDSVMVDNGVGWDAKFYRESFSYIPEYGSDLIDLLKPRSGERILDLGCGTGDLTAAIAEYGCNVIGIDSDPNMIELAGKNYPHIEFVCANGESFSLSSEVDAVFSNAVLHWIKQPESVISNVKNALNSGGRFVAEMGAYRNVQTITDALYVALQEHEIGRDKVDFPWYFPKAGEYNQLLEKVGFDVTFLSSFLRPTPLDDCPNGLSDWIQMFAKNFVKAVPAAQQSQIILRTVELCRDKLYKDERWVTDYRRLRFRAELCADKEKNSIV